MTVLERAVEGEKRVARQILEQTRLNGEDIDAIKAHLVRLEQRFDDKFDGLATKQDALESKFRGLDRKFDAFVKEFPALVAQTMRDVLNEREK